MSKVFLIIGKSYSGKDTLLSKILDNKPFCERNDLYQLVRYTTRSIRPSEVDGEDYHFITDEYYEENFKDNPMSVTTSFNSEFGYLHYITDFSKLDKRKNYIMTGDPDSIKPFKKILGDKLCIIWLLPPDWVLFKRFSNRDDNPEYSEKKYKEIQRRYVDDLIKFNKANSFLVDTTSMINLGEFVYHTHILLQIQKFIDGDKDSVIFNSIGTTKFKKEYNASYLIKSYYDIIKDFSEGKIPICNGAIILNTKEETFTIADEVKIIPQLPV